MLTDRIDGYLWKESTQKKSDLYLNAVTRKSRFPINLTDGRTSVMLVA